MSRRHAVIMGAGLAGSLMAIFLARRGFEVDVYEGRPDMRTVEIPAGRSINLALANRGIRPLREVGLYEQVQELLTTMRGRMLHDEEGGLSFQPYGQDEHEVIYSVSRGGLNTLLLDTAEHEHGVRLHFNQRCQAVDLDSGELRMQDLAGGRQYLLAGGPVIAADGAGSVIRRVMAKRPGHSAREDYLSHAYKELNIPPAADGSWRIEPHALHIWPRGEHMVIALPNSDGSFTVTLFLAREGERDSFAALADEAAVEEFFQRLFPDLVPLIPTLAEDFLANPTGSMVTVYSEPWHVGGRFLLIGDAAHSIVPFHGQGMNCAFEDCAELDRCIGEHAEVARPNWERVFAAFSERRKPNADAIARMALENYVEMRDTVRDPRFQLKKRLAWELEKRHPGRFVPRYSMVMFHHLPYAEALRRGALQQNILEELLGGASDLDAVDYAQAAKLIDERLGTAPAVAD